MRWLPSGSSAMAWSGDTGIEATGCIDDMSPLVVLVCSSALAAMEASTDAPRRASSLLLVTSMYTTPTETPGGVGRAHAPETSMPDPSADERPQPAATIATIALAARRARFTGW